MFSVKVLFLHRSATKYFSPQIVNCEGKGKAAAVTTTTPRSRRTPAPPRWVRRSWTPRDARDGSTGQCTQSSAEAQEAHSTDMVR